MRIAQVAPLYESVPPKLYGGTERVVHYLTEELVHRGHDVTLFASGDSTTSANLIPACPAASRLNDEHIDALALHFVMLEDVFRLASTFEIIHFHIDYLHFPVSRRYDAAHVSTLHGRLDIPNLTHLYREFSDEPLVSISNAQRGPIPWANWQGTVYHGLPVHLLPYGEGGGGYLAFLGRISPEKGVDRAIEIAQRAGLPLKIAAKIEKTDREYFESQIRKLWDSPAIEYVGEIGESDKAEFLGKARALLFPIDWPEPFGLVMIEAMSCGTPVIAYHGGSVDEVIDDGVTGYVVGDIESAARAVDRVGEISRPACRRAFESRFTSTRMVDDYLKIYSRLARSTNGVEDVEPVPSE